MIKSLIVMLFVAILIALACWGAIKLWFVIKRERNKEFQDSVNQTIRADAAADRLDASYERSQKKGK